MAISIKSSTMPTALTVMKWDASLPPAEKPRYFALSRTTDRVLQILMNDDLSRVRADSVAESLGMSSTTLRRRLRADHTCYQFLLDRARQYRCERELRQRWKPGKCLAIELVPGTVMKHAPLVFDGVVAAHDFD